MKKYLIFDLDGTLIASTAFLKREIYNYFDNYYPDYLDNLKYCIDYSKVGDFDDLLSNVFKDNIGEKTKEKIKNEIYSLIYKEVDNIGFISGTQEKIKEICQDFQLFISTGNSTSFAKTILEKGGILDCFELIVGGDIIPKNIEHVQMMKDHIGDPYFYDLAVFIGDGPRDRQIAEEKGIKYIRVGDGIIDSIAQIDFYSL